MRHLNYMVSEYIVNINVNLLVCLRINYMLILPSFQEAKGGISVQLSEISIIN
jgi:hypothetical protein